MMHELIIPNGTRCAQRTRRQKLVRKRMLAQAPNTDFLIRSGAQHMLLYVTRYEMELSFLGLSVSYRNVAISLKRTIPTTTLL